MTLLGVLGIGRAQAAARMTEHVRIGTLTQQTDRDTLDVDSIFDPVHEGPARVKFPSYTVGEREAAGQGVAAQDIIVSLPGGVAYPIDVDMRLIVDSSTADAGLVGRVFRIKGRPQSGQTTATRFPVEETGEQITEGS